MIGRRLESGLQWILIRTNFACIFFDNILSKNVIQDLTKTLLRCLLGFPCGIASGDDKIMTRNVIRI